MTERLLSQNPFRTCDDACGARAPGGQDTPPLQRGRPNEPQDTALAPGRTVPGAGRRGSVPVRRAGARSFADDPGLSRGIVAGRAVPSLRSPEIHPPTLASVPPRSGTPPRGPRAGESGTPRAGRQKREGRGKRRRSGSPIKCPPCSTPALCPARALGTGPGPPPAPPPAPRRPSAKRPSPLPGPAPPGRPYCPCRKWEGSTRPLSSPPILGGEEASLLPSRKREGRRASVFAGARCAGTYSMGQPRRVSTQSSRRQGLWRRPGRRLRETAEPGPGGLPARGVRILAPVRRRVETGPGREASGGRHVTGRCFSRGAAVPGEARWLRPTGRTPLSESQYAA